MELSRRQLIRRSAEAAVALGLVGTGIRAVLSLSAPYPNAGLLASPAWLQRRLDDTDRLRIVDARAALVYRRGHIPNAVNVWDNDVNVWGQIPRQLASIDKLTETFRRAGISADQTVVVYDAGDGRWAARLLWALEHAGHPDVRLLDGGFSGWSAAGGSVSHDSATIGAADFEPRPDDRRRLTSERLREALQRTGVQLVDARPFSAYADGHIPGALSWPADGLLGTEGTFKRAHSLRLSARDAGLALQDAGPTVVYSDTGLSASQAYLALRLLGLTDVRLYDGGWAEWSTLADVPVEQASSSAASAQRDHRSTCW